VQKKAEVKQRSSTTRNKRTMLPTEPEPTHDQILQLNLKRDLPEAFQIVFQSMAATPIISALFVLLTLFDDLLPPLTLATLWALILQLIITRNIINNTYKAVFPESIAASQHFQTKCLARMFGIQFVWGLGTLLCGLLLIAPGIYFALALSLCLQFVVLENESGFAAIKSSWNLTMGKKWQIIKYVVLGPLALTVIALAAALGTGLGVVILAPNLDSANTDKITDIIAAVATLTVELIVLSAQPLAVKIWIDLMHKSGRSTAIERKIAQQQVT
jgi:hypothetical protein